MNNRVIHIRACTSDILVITFASIGAGVCVKHAIMAIIKLTAMAIGCM
jgi:hypothetical protein